MRAYEKQVLLGVELGGAEFSHSGDRCGAVGGSGMLVELWKLAHCRWERMGRG